MCSAPNDESFLNFTLVKMRPRNRTQGSRTAARGCSRSLTKEVAFAFGDLRLMVRSSGPEEPDSKPLFVP